MPEKRSHQLTSLKPWTYYHVKNVSIFSQIYDLCCGLESECRKREREPSEDLFNQKRINSCLLIDKTTALYKLENQIRSEINKGEQQWR